MGTTIIRIWLPTDRQNHRISCKDSFLNGGNPGHVSIETVEVTETEGFYASFWPVSGAIRYYNKGLFGTKPGARPGGFSDNVKQDEFAEASASGLAGKRKEADRKIELKSLDSQKMKEVFEQYKKETPDWVMVGDSMVNCKQGQSCTSIAYNILAAGGIGELVGPLGMKMLFATPESIEDLALTALNAEKKKLEGAENSKRLKAKL